MKYLQRLFSGPAVPDFGPRDAVIWEPCSKSHGEIVPGYAKLLLDLGYRVTVLMTPDRIDEGLFSRFVHPDLTLMRLSQRRIARLARAGGLAKAGVVLVSTLGKLPTTPSGHPDLRRAFGERQPERLLLVEHDAGPKIERGIWDPSWLTLRRLVGVDATSVVVNPHHFGTIQDKSKTSGKTVFVMVGAARSGRRDGSLIENAVRRLLAAGQTTFEVRLIGKPSPGGIAPDLTEHMIELGRVDFAHLYDEVEQGDFILTALSPKISAHKLYATVKTTGSFQLCYGFHKPCLVHRDFVDGTAIGPANSLLYADLTSLTEAMTVAIQMSAADYNTLRGAMAQDAQVLYQSSLEALRGRING